MAIRDAVVEITEESNGGLAARLLRCRLDSALIDYPNAQKFRPLQLDPATLPPLDTSANVEQYGSRIRSALENHSAIKAELAQIFQAPHRAILQFWIGPPEGECYRWETLCQPPLSFLALRDLCTVSRLADINSQGADVRAYDDVVRLAAFLSPIKISAKQELACLLREIQVARAAGLNVQCTVYLGEQDLLDKTKADIAAGVLQGVAAQSVPPTTDALEETLRKNPAEILHFFCHGRSAAGLRSLELATISDNDAEREVGSAVISVERLEAILNKTGVTWVTVLNACCGAKAVPDLHSMALTLARRGSPMAVGMAEPISSVDATIFSQAFYEALFGILRERLVGAAPGAVSLDLAPAVINARRKVYNQYNLAPPEAYGRWALPLLYERIDPLVVQIAPPVVVDDAMRLRINTVAGALRTLDQGAPDAMRDEFLALLDKPPKVPLSLRPDRNGVLRA